MESLFVVMEIKGIEIEALAVTNLAYAHYLPSAHGERPTRRRFHNELLRHLSLSHYAP